MGSGVSIKERSESNNNNRLISKRRSSLPNTIQMNGNNELRLKRIYHVNNPNLPDEKSGRLPTAASLPPPPPAPIQNLVQTQPQTVALIAPIQKTLLSEIRPRTMMTQVMTSVPSTAVVSNYPVSTVNTPNIIKVEPARTVVPLQQIQVQPQQPPAQNKILQVNPVVIFKKPTQIVTRNISTQPRAMLITPMNSSQLIQVNKSNQPIKIITKS
jgi:hypothetical protein